MDVRRAISSADLRGIHHLNQVNLRKNIKDEEKIRTEGYVSWEYSMALLQKMHEYHPSILAIDQDQVVGYALVALKVARRIHPELDLVLQKLDRIVYDGKPLVDYKYYAMGQVCVADGYRGQGVFRQLFKAHKAYMEGVFDFVVTTIAVTNTRSVRAHEAVGFKIIHEFDDHFGNWFVVLWDWN